MKTRSGHLYQKTNGGTWYVRTQVDGKVIVRSTKTKNRREAEKRRIEIMEPYALGDKAKVYKEVVNKLHETEDRLTVLNEPPPVTIHKAWIKYIKSPHRLDSGESTLDRYGSIWIRFDKWITDNHSDIEILNQVTEQTAAVYAENLKAAKIAASTFNQHKNFLKLLWKVLLPHKSNPWQRIASQHLNTLAARKQPLTSSQFESLLAAVENETDYHDLFVLLAGTGLRLVDVVMMKWSVIDFKSNVLTLAPKKTERRQGKIIYVPILPEALEVLNRRQSGKVLDPVALILPELAEIYQRDRSALTKKITKAFNRAGMETKTEQANRKRKTVVYGAHSLRHRYITEASKAGIPMEVIGSIVGHSSISQTRHYNHLNAEYVASLSKGISGTQHAPAMLEVQTQATKEPRTVQQARAGLMEAIAVLNKSDIKQAKVLIKQALKKLETVKGGE